MDIRFGMLVLAVQDLQRSIEFYRLLGLGGLDPSGDRPVSLSKLTDDVTLVLITEALAGLDPRPAGMEHRAQQLLEFLVGDDAAVDAEWQKLTAAGYHGRQPPANRFGPYAAMVDDPDGNVTLITSDPG